MIIADFVFTVCNDSKVGNMLCEDENNVFECEYDQGDCCLHETDKEHCDLCTCHQSLIPTITPCK